MSLLTICQDAADAIGIQRPSTIIGNTSDTARTLLAFAKEEVKSLHRSFDWPVLIREGELEVFDNTVNFQLKHLGLPATFDRFTADTMWDRDERLEVSFPNSAKAFARWRGLDLFFPSHNRRARLSYGSYLTTNLTGGSGVAVEFLEPFTAGDVGKIFHHEWVTKWVISTGGPFATDWQGDSDTCLLNEYIVTLGVIWRYKASKQMAYAKDEQKYNRELEREKAACRSSKALNMGACDSIYPFSGLIPDHGYG